MTKDVLLKIVGLHYDTFAPEAEEETEPIEVIVPASYYLKNNKPDGEIIFLAADPDAKIKGVGSVLLRSLEECIPGKTLYLHTDDACTYQFYEHRGFQLVEEQSIVLDMPKGKVPLKCFIYSKQIQ